MKIKSKKIVLRDKVIEGTLTLEDGVIQSIDPYEKGDRDAKDYGDLIIAPGLIDIHNHGYAGWSFTGSSNKDDINHLRQRMLLEGVTSMLTTSSTLGIKSVLESMKEDSEFMTSVIGIHIEGPFLNSEQHGAAPPDTKFPLPDLEYMKEIYEEADEFLKMMTIAPEMQGSEEIISFLRDRDVKVSIGHSNVTYRELETIKSKVDSMTHLGNAMSGIHHREIGALGFGLLHTDVWVEMIADGIHLSNPMMDLVFHTKDLDRILLISDTVPFAGFDEGTYESLNGKIIVDSDGKLLNEHGNINGSSFPLLSDLSYLNRNFDLSLSDLFKMASYNQTQFLGIDDVGQIKEGYKADLLVLDEDLKLVEIFKEGKELNYEQQMKENNPNVNAHLKDVEFLNFYSLRS